MSETYFVGSLNYSLANEDTKLELELLPEGLSHVASVAGSGGRCVPLLAKRPKRLTCIDLSPLQLALCRLRVETIRALSHAEFCAFWGYPPRSMLPAERKSTFEDLAIASEDRLLLHPVFQSVKWGSILYEGKWEKTFQKLAFINRKLTGTKGLGIFGTLNLEEQQAYYETEFPRKRWDAVLALVGNSNVFNSLLYKGSFPQKNIKDTHFGFYRKAFDHLFRNTLARENFFLQLVFFGRVMFNEGVPIEAKPEVFAAAKAALPGCEIDYVQGDLIETVSKRISKVDFVSLSDVPSYFTGTLEQTFLSDIRPNLNMDAMVVLRNYLRVPEQMDTSGYSLVTARHQAQIDIEKVGIYQIDVFKTA